MGRGESQKSHGPRDDAPRGPNRPRPPGRNGLPPELRERKDQPMASQHNPTELDNDFRLCTTALEQALVGLGQAAEGFILSHSRLPRQAVPEDRERNIGRGSPGAIAKGCPLGRASVGRFRITAVDWSISLHVYRRRVGARWAYEVFIQHGWNRNLPVVKFGKRLLAGDQPPEHPQR